MSDKIKPHHLERKAILYIRQSSLYQVNHNLESQKLQYAMEERLQQLGWREIEVVDDDLGRSAAGTVTRAGFERMVAEVCMGKVGAVAAREVSRFARNSREWQQLIEVCRVVDTLLIDQETAYTPRQSNDRLLLGLKGSLNEQYPGAGCREPGGLRMCSAGGSGCTAQPLSGSGGQRELASVSNSIPNSETIAGAAGVSHDDLQVLQKIA